MYSSKKTFDPVRVMWYRVILCSLAVIITIASFFVLVLQKQEAAQAVQESGYVVYLRAYEGKIGLYHPHDDQPYQVTDVVVSALPQGDQAALAKGVEVQTPAQLRQMLEDYGQ